MEANEQVERPKFVFEVPEDNFPVLRERFEKMVRRARKHHLEPPRFEVIHEADWEVVVKESSPGSAWGDDLEDGFGNTYRLGGPSWMPGALEPRKTRVVHYYYVTVEGTRPHVAGWEFIATLDYSDYDGKTGVLVKTVPGISGNVPVRYRTSPPKCDHCGYIRRRNETYVVRGGDGDTKQVGKNCLSDFMPSVDAADVAAQMEWLYEAAEMASNAEDEDCFGGGGHGGRGSERVPIEALLCTTQAIIEVDGWLSKTKAGEQGGKPTALKVHSLYKPPRGMGRREMEEFARWRATIAVRAAERKDEIERMVADALEWIRSQSPEVEDDYLYNLLTTCRGETVRLDRLGLACSLMAAYRRHLDGELRKREATERPASEYVGEPGKRALIRGCECRFIGEPYEGGFGVSRFVLFLRGGKDAIAWYASGDSALAFEAGRCYDLVCTPKRHEEKDDKRWGRQKRTIVNRCATATAKDAENRKLAVI